MASLAGHRSIRLSFIALDYFVQVSFHLFDRNFALGQLCKSGLQISHAIVRNISIQVAFRIGRLLERIFYLRCILFNILAHTGLAYHFL